MRWSGKLYRHPQDSLCQDQQLNLTHGRSTMYPACRAAPLSIALLLADQVGKYYPTCRTSVLYLRLHWFTSAFPPTLSLSGRWLTLGRTVAHNPVKSTPVKGNFN